MIPSRILIGIGVVLLIGAGITGYSQYRFVQSAQVAQGSVVALNAGSSHPEIEFTDASGSIVRYPQGGFIFGYRVGDSVAVLYDPLDPRHAVIDTPGALWFTPGLLALLGLAFALFPLVPGSLQSRR